MPMKNADDSDHHGYLDGSTLMPARAFVFDAYGTLFDVHAAVARHRDAAGPEADRFSEVWRIKQLEYAWLLSAAGQYLDFWRFGAEDYKIIRALNY